MALTPELRADLQADLGITNDQAVFTDAELDRLYERASGDYNLTVYYGYRQLLAQANKFHNYTTGMTRIEAAQMREHIRDSMEFWKEEARRAGNQMRIAGLLEVPPRNKEVPDA